MMAGDPNHREFTRVPIKIEIQIKVRDKVFLTDNTKDLSMKGVFLESDDELSLGEPCEVSIFLVGTDPIEIHFKGKVGRAVKNGIGIEFTEMDLESYEHLQNLLRYRAADAEKIDKEVHNHVGLKRK